MATYGIKDNKSLVRIGNARMFLSLGTFYQNGTFNEAFYFSEYKNGDNFEGTKTYMKCLKDGTYMICARGQMANNRGNEFANIQRFIVYDGNGSKKTDMNLLVNGRGGAFCCCDTVNLKENEKLYFAIATNTEDPCSGSLDIELISLND